MPVAPRARRDGVVAQPLDEDMVVYEAATGTAHRLDAATTKVWQMADGSRSVSELARGVGLSERAVLGALVKLQSAGLLAPAPVVTRRWLPRWGAVAGA